MKLALLAAAAFLRRQPVRCAISVCKPFESACTTNTECVTDTCYEGKCGLGVTCTAAQKLCFTDGPHTCCTGTCKGVAVRRDCLKLLGLDGALVAHQGINVDRQCERVGVCGHWPGADPGPGVLTTPWAVDPGDVVAKYYALAGLTFKPGTHVDAAHVIARRVGRAHTGVSPAKDKPRGVTDAGVLHFTSDAYVARTVVGSYKVGEVTYCIAPVLEGGEGGGYYAVGIDCCSAKEFSCGDLGGTSAVVVSSHAPEFAQARLLLEAAGVVYKSKDRGIETPAPLFVSWSELPEGEQTNPTTGLGYVLPTNTTFCVAPIGEGLSKVGFWAVGQDCCDDASFSCGATDAEARSGKLATDWTGDFINAAHQAEFKYGAKTDPRPIFLAWTSEVLVPTP